MKLNPTPTPARILVLEFLEKNPGYQAPCHGTARNHCSKLGWICAARNTSNQIIGQQLTDQGRAILSAHRLAQIPKSQPATPPVAAISEA